jgi:hypothetical protein
MSNPGLAGPFGSCAGALPWEKTEYPDVMTIITSVKIRALANVLKPYLPYMVSSCLALIFV